MDWSDSFFTMPAAPGGLAFDKNDFVKSNFSVDDFLEEHKNVASETMRDNLGAYLKVLRVAMIDLINKDYNNFVKLSATLIGFDQSLNDLKYPLTSTKNDVQKLKEFIDETTRELKTWMSVKKFLTKEKLSLLQYDSSLNLYQVFQNVEQQISEENLKSSLMHAERAVSLYNKVIFCLRIKTEDQIICADVGLRLQSKLLNMMQHYFEHNLINELVTTLLLLASLDKIAETEKHFKKRIVDVNLNNIITETNLQKTSLSEIFTKVLALLDTDLNLILDITNQPKLMNLPKRFQFLINSFWCAVENTIEAQLPSIFAPGNPNFFYSRYNDSMIFLDKLHTILGSEKLMKMLIETNEYSCFMKRWNLPIYFQIRFQEIAGACEAVFSEGALANNSGSPFNFQGSSVCWDSLIKSWSDGIFIEAIAHKFFKLILQLLSRYSLWVASHCGNITPSSNAEEVNPNGIKKIIHLFLDILQLSQKIPELFDIIKSKVKNDKKIHMMKENLDEASNNLLKVIPLLKKSIVNEFVRYGYILLKNVSDIPRLYRKTNKSVPQKPCNYIERMSEKITAFRNDNETVLGNEFTMSIVVEIYNQITLQFYKSVKDVLTSVQKTEESLRRLKLISQGNSQQLFEQSMGVTDSEKIRIQLYIDVTSYCDNIRRFGLQLEGVNGANQLVELVKCIGVNL